MWKLRVHYSIKFLLYHVNLYSINNNSFVYKSIVKFPIIDNLFCIAFFYHTFYNLFLSLFTYNIEKIILEEMFIHVWIFNESKWQKNKYLCEWTTKKIQSHRFYFSQSTSGGPHFLRINMQLYLIRWRGEEFMSWLIKFIV